MRIAPAAVVLLLLAPACGTRPAAAPPDGNETAIAIAPNEEQPLPGAADRITAIDAASGDGQAMPADSTAPSAYDLAERAARDKDAEIRPEGPAVPALPAGAARLSTAADLAGADESVSAGD